jgi:heptosyltransferase-2
MHKRSAGEVNRLIAQPADAPGRSTEEPLPAAAHQMHEYLHLAAALGAEPEPLPPRLHITPAEIQQTEQSFISELAQKASGQPLVLLGMNPGAQYGPAKRWPAESFAAVARAVSGRVGKCLWLAFGSEADTELCEDITRRAGGGVANLAGRTSLRELMALLKLCRVLLTNDSGPMHVAAALGTPVVVPFGSTAPELTGPGLPGDRQHTLLKSAAPCSPCFRRACPIDLRCMTGISPDRVTEAVLHALSLK